MVEKKVDEKIDDLISEALRHQHGTGAFHFCFENSLLTDAMMIVLIRMLKLPEKSLLDALVKRLLFKQSKEGYWKLYEDDRGNLSATVLAYHSLLYSGTMTCKHSEMKKAEHYIKKWGGIEKVDSMTSIFLALNGHLNWPHLFHIPMLFLLIPKASPVSFYDLSSYARAHFAPILLCQDLRYSIKTKWTPDLTHLIMEDRSMKEDIKQAWTAISQFPSNQLYKARKRAEQYMLQRIEADGTLLNYATATFFMIYAMLALGYEKHAPSILRAFNGLKGMLCDSNSHLQNSPSTIWDTALLSYTLQEAGIVHAVRSTRAANHYLVRHQQTKYGDWAITREGIAPAGWGFSEGNTTHPDVDDTTVALRALKDMKNESSRWHDGVSWLLAMQNHDGGWPAFEPDRQAFLLKDLPIDGARSSFPDDSSADLTGRTVEFLCNYAELNRNHPSIRKGTNWLIRNQESDGSWRGRWGICYIYGTWAALTALKAAGYPSDFTPVRKGIQFLKKIQRDDGGWGESCQSDIQQKFVPLHFSTPSQTAWAVDALSVCKETGESLNRGVDYLLKKSFDMEERTYPTGAGLPGGFYIRYHSYEVIWPLLALSHYKKLQIKH